MTSGIHIGGRKPTRDQIRHNGIIILDGPDGTGKTTLAKEIIKQAGPAHKYIHLSYRFPEQMFLYQTAALHWAHKWSIYGTVIIDRHWMSEGIYANVYRGGSRWPHMGRMMDRVFRGLGTMNVLCLPEDIDAHDRHFQSLKNQRPEMYPDQRAVAKRYLDLWYGNKDCTGSDYASQLTRFGGVKDRDDFMRYCYTENEVEGLSTHDYVEFLFEKLDMRWAAQPTYVTKRQMTTAGETHGYNHNFAGFLDTAEWLVVGDMCNPKYRAIRYPFLDYSNSSLFLAKCLHELGFDETRALYINVNDYYGAVGIVEALKRKPNLRLICLGNDALSGLKERCTYLQTLAVYPEIYKTCHPSYACRFNQKDMLMRDLGFLLGERHDELCCSLPSN